MEGALGIFSFRTVPQEKGDCELYKRAVAEVRIERDVIPHERTSFRALGETLWFPDGTDDPDLLKLTAITKAAELFAATAEELLDLCEIVVVPLDESYEHSTIFFRLRAQKELIDPA